MRAALALMLASGIAGLSYQVVWTQQCALWLGHEAAAVLAVVAAFFGGLALGALALGGRIARSAHPARWYAGCEALIAAWSLVLAFALPRLAPLLLAAIGERPEPAWQWTAAFAATFFVLLPATAAMGATLPAMTRLRAAWSNEGIGSGIGALYAANTAGAVLGVLACAFWLLPSIGLMGTAALCAVLNLACAAVALALGGASSSLEPAPPRAETRTDTTGRGVLATLALTGLLGIGYEVLVVRVLSQVAEDTVYTFALLLAVYLVGSAAGAAAWQRWRSRGARQHGDAAVQRRRLLLAQAACCLVGIAALWAAEDVHAAVRTALGGGMAAALAAEAALALVAFALPTVAMGALFAHLAEEAHAAGQGVARALGVNTLGAAAAPLLFGVLLLPALGPKFALLLVAAGYLVLAWRPHAPSQRAAWSAVAAATAGIALWAPPLAFITVPEGGRVLSYREGALAAVSVVEDGDGVSRLRIDNRQQEGSSATRFADARQALLPLLLVPQPAPQHALFLGLGTGITASAAAEAEPALQVDAVELLPEVIASAALFTGPPDRHPNLRLLASDARRHVKTSTQRHDLVVADNFHPARSGSGALYTVEHFQAVRARLAEHGLFCQWLPLHQLDLATLRSIVRSYQAVFPEAWALLATNSLETPVLGLVARADGQRFSLAALQARLAAWPDAQRARHGLPDALAVLGGFVAGPRALAGFAADAPLNTDDRPVVAYHAPRITYAPDSLPRDRLFALLDELALEPVELLNDEDDTGADTATRARVAAYWRARDLYLAAGRHVRPSADPRRMLAQVRQPLLDVLRTSPDFRPAREPLLRLAAALAHDAPATAEALRAELARLPEPPPLGPTRQP